VVDLATGEENAELARNFGAIKYVGPYLIEELIWKSKQRVFRIMAWLGSLDM
jgi:hypothetical protein